MKSIITDGIFLIHQNLKPENYILFRNEFLIILNDISRIETKERLLQLEYLNGAFKFFRVVKLDDRLTVNFVNYNDDMELINEAEPVITVFYPEVKNILLDVH